MGKMGVLFTDHVQDENYHILLKNGLGSNQVVVRDVLVTDRRAKGSDYTRLYNWMCRANIDVLWVHPDTQLSIWVNRADFNLIPEGLEWFSPVKGEDGKTGIFRPSGISLHNHTKYIFFPAHGEYVHSNRKDDKTWIIPSEDHLFNTVDYLERAIEHPFLWSPAKTGMLLLDELNNNGVRIEPFLPTDLWKDEIARKMIARPVWVRRGRDGKQGLTDAQKSLRYGYVFDKNAQFLGACVNLVLGSGRYREATGEEFSLDKFGFWEYAIKDVSNSAFNGYGLYCPLSIHDTWCSTEVLKFASATGIQFEVKRGVYWPELAGRPLDKWAKRLWEARVFLESDKHLIDTIATHNGIGTIKKMYIDMIGQLSHPYAKRFYHKDWNRMITQKAIHNQGYSILKRWNEHRIKPVMVVNDSIFVLSNEKEPNKVYPGILNFQSELRGYKCLGRFVLTDEIISAFETQKPLEIEAIIKRSISEQ